MILSSPRIATSIVAAFLVALSGASFAANPPASAASTAAKASTPTKEMRERMAAQHEQMAACLRSDKPMSECRAEMHKSCREMMADQGCTMMRSSAMMERGGGAMGMGHMKRNSPSSSSPPK